tara:strand:+ start:424 stop:639 length:216 start_codon:yes stop_codon:yes gene_type:complete
MILKKLCLNLKDKTKSRDQNHYDVVNINIERKLVDRSSEGNNREVRPDGAKLVPGGSFFEHNILLYTENLK